MKLPIVGRTYRYRYGYPWHWAILAELAWRIEHLGVYRGGDGGVLGAIRRWGYAKRHHFERKGAGA